MITRAQTSNRSRWLSPTLVAGLSLLASLPLTACDTVGPLVLQSSDQSVEAYETLTREWIRWAMLIPHADNPIEDQTGASCTEGQGDGPWFLAGTYGGSVERECTIPADTPLFFPLINRWVVPPDDYIEQPGTYEWYVETWAPAFQAWKRGQTCELTLRIDGEDLLADTAELDAELYVAITEVFSVELADDNWWTANGYDRPGGTYNYALADGHWALFKPLEPGDHTLEFGGKLCDEEGGIAFETAATYHLHVEGTPED